MAEVATFVRRLRLVLDVDAMPYAVVPEFHKDGHVHAHLLLDRFVDKAVLSEQWHHGWVDVRRFTSGLGEGARAASRKAAAYASKYVTKAFEDRGNARLWRHRYEVAEGFQPRVVKRSHWSTSMASVLDDLARGHGQRIIYAFHSDGIEDYSGRPFLWVVLEAVTA